MDESMLEQTAEIVIAFLHHNLIAARDLPTAIQAVHRALVSVANTQSAPADAPAPPAKPAVAIRQSVTPDHLVCLEDGKTFKSLKRHLRAEHNLDPAAYRAKWGLKPDYPMVAESYSKARSGLAKTRGFGAGGRAAALKPVLEPPEASAKPARRPRKQAATVG